jgi:allantoin racemase
MHRILVVNPNSSGRATDRILKSLAPLQNERLDLELKHSMRGPEGVDTILDISIAGIETVRLIAENRKKYDAFIIACGADPGLDAARQITDKPVVGIAEAGILIGWPLGRTFAMLTGMKQEIPQMQALVRCYGLEERLACVLAVDMATAELTKGGDHLMDHNIIIAQKAVDEHLAEVIVLSGAVVSDLAQPLQDKIGVPVVAGLTAAVKMAESLLDLGLQTSHVYSYWTPKKDDRLIGYEDLQDVYST